MDNVTDDFIMIDESGTILVSGEWTISHIKQINKRIKKISEHHSQNIRAEIIQLDTAGAMLLHSLGIKSGLQDVTAIQGLQSQQQALLELVAHTTQEEHVDPRPEMDFISAALTTLGKVSVRAWDGLIEFLRFLGETTVTLGTSLVHLDRMRFMSIVRHIRETGISAIPIVSLIAFLISIVLAYQGASQLRRFGAEIFTIDMVAISVLREMGVLLTAIMIAGRSGSAFTAEIGMMKVNEEVDAMRLIGINPFEVLVLPRLLALMLTLPLLTFIADIMALAGGGIISYSLINIGFDQYVDRVHQAVGMNDFLVGLIKAPIFAFFIAVVGCMRGMQVSGSAESIGRQTTASVVQSIFLVLLLDALFSVLFTKLGI